MRRLSFLIALLLVFTLTATSVFAAGSAYYFDVRPSIQTLPLFSPDDTDGSVAIYEGFLHEGVYDVFAFLTTVGEFAFSEPAVISYSPMSDYDGLLGCQLEFSVTVSEVDYSCRADVVYLDSSNVTCLFLYGTDTSIPFFEGDRVAFVAADPETGSSSSGGFLKDLVSDLFGPYEQQTETITETLADGSTVTIEQRIPGIAGLDYPWIASVCLFALVLLCFFRIVGGLIKQ